MSILASRSHLCINQNVRRSANPKNECMKLNRDPNTACPYKKNVQKLFKCGAVSHGLWNTEQFIQFGVALDACPYDAALSLALKADIIFSPYNYIFDPIIRRIMKLDTLLPNSLIIFDEAHNIEQICRESVSYNFQLEDIEITRQELTEAVKQIDVLFHTVELYREKKLTEAQLKDQNNTLKGENNVYQANGNDRENKQPPETTPVMTHVQEAQNYLDLKIPKWAQKFDVELFIDGIASIIISNIGVAIRGLLYFIEDFLQWIEDKQQIVDEALLLNQQNKMQIDQVGNGNQNYQYQYGLSLQNNIAGGRIITDNDDDQDKKTEMLHLPGYEGYSLFSQCGITPDTILILQALQQTIDDFQFNVFEDKSQKSLINKLNEEEQEQEDDGDQEIEDDELNDGNDGINSMQHETEQQIRFGILIGDLSLRLLEKLLVLAENFFALDGRLGSKYAIILSFHNQMDLNQMRKAKSEYDQNIQTNVKQSRQQSFPLWQREIIDQLTERQPISDPKFSQQEIKKKQNQNQNSIQQLPFVGASVGRLWKEISFKALSPSVAFHSLTKALSIILTSGTLAPLVSFASELEAQFNQTLEAGHVVDMNKQVWVGTIPRLLTSNANIEIQQQQQGKSIMLQSTYQSTRDQNILDAYGESLLRLVQVVPAGMLVFFCSFSQCFLFLKHWKRTGMLEQISQYKRLFLEPRNQVDQYHGSNNQSGDGSNNSNQGNLFSGKGQWKGRNRGKQQQGVGQSTSNDKEQDDKNVLIQVIKQFRQSVIENLKEQKPKKKSQDSKKDNKLKIDDKETIQNDEDEEALQEMDIMRAQLFEDDIVDEEQKVETAQLAIKEEEEKKKQKKSSSGKRSR
ncbi:MAG: putative Fanconi anemia group J protein [Streblomastix strix]|uniref:Putative Fanconi anemia group J protein n=1 Tax=Streblomastix strix TaxID=222440 RepID=A0A5J4W4K6_9EUKA|nr:MAG: putative Fanconi anemia group J protein [Streblomastix strix]